MKPPLTRRYCIGCDKITSFEFNKVIGHSECMECGCRFALNPRNKKRIEKIKTEMKNKKAGLVGKLILIVIIIFVFLVVLIKYPQEGKILLKKLYELLVISLDLLIKLVGLTIKKITNS